MTKSLADVCVAEQLPPATRAYKLVVSIAKHTKLKNVKRVQMKLAKLYHIDEAMRLHPVEVFVNFVRYHTKSGKLRKQSYRTILRKAREALEAIYPVVLTEDVKRFSVKKSIEKIKQAQASPLAPKAEHEVKRKRMTPIDEDKSLVRMMRNEAVQVLEPDQCGIITRPIVFFKTMIPQQIFRTFSVEYGLQKLAHYTCATHAITVGVPNYRDGQILSHDEKLQQALQCVKIRNKILRRRGKELVGMVRAKEVSTQEHTYWLLLPVHVNNDVDVRIGSWDFSERPRSTVEVAQTA